MAFDLSTAEYCSAISSCMVNDRSLRSNHVPNCRCGRLYSYFIYKVDQLDEIKNIILMKVAHRKNIKRRKERFGYESNSLIGLDLANASVIAPVADDDVNPFDT
jgi:hypothetical protein